MMFGGFGWRQPPEVKVKFFSEPIGETHVAPEVFSEFFFFNLDPSQKKEPWDPSYNHTLQG